MPSYKAFDLVGLYEFFGGDPRLIWFGLTNCLQGFAADTALASLFCWVWTLKRLKIVAALGEVLAHAFHHEHVAGRLEVSAH